VGRLDARGNLSITGRIKELLITAGGENVAPVLIENEVKLELPFLSNVMVVGDAKKYLAAVLTLKYEVNKNGTYM
jgi:long-chain-fatty-acid--CoA ligase ACSBG